VRPQQDSHYFFHTAILFLANPEMKKEKKREERVSGTTTTFMHQHHI